MNPFARADLKSRQLWRIPGSEAGRYLLTLFVLYFCGGILLILLSIPRLLEKVKPNPVYGFRVRATLDDPGTWYAVNKYFGRRLLVVGVVFSIDAAALYFVPGISVDGYALAMLAIFGIAFSIAMFQSWRYMNSLATISGDK
jgi:uncharacterized membrane protein